MLEWLPSVLKGIGDARVADVLREKVGLLDLQRDKAVGERDTLATQLAQAKAKIETLESDIADLRAQLDDAREQLQHREPVRELPGRQQEVLLHLMHDDGGMTVEEIAQAIGEIPSMARHHCEELASIGFVAQTRFRGEHRRVDFGSSDLGYALTKEGRKWIAQQSA